MKIIAHRGNHQESLENSWHSFQKAIETPCHMIELDVRMAKDDSLWIMHDDSLKKTCNIQSSLSNMTRDQILKTKLINGEPIPSFEEVLLKILPRIHINIEIKQSSQKYLDKIITLLKNTSNLHKVILSSFETGPLEYISKKIETLQLAFLWGEDNSKEVNPLDYLQSHPKFFFHPQADYLNWKLINQMHEKNITIFPWVPMEGVELKNKEKPWEIMKLFGVHGLCTNFPDELKKWQEQSLLS